MASQGRWPSPALCSGSSTPAFPPTCTATSVTLTAGGTGATTVTIGSTTAVTAANRAPAGLNFGLRSGAATLALMFFLVAFRRRKAFRALAVFALMAIGLSAVSGLRRRWFDQNNKEQRRQLPGDAGRVRDYGGCGNRHHGNQLHNVQRHHQLALLVGGQRPRQSEGVCLSDRQSPSIHNTQRASVCHKNQAASWPMRATPVPRLCRSVRMGCRSAAGAGWKFSRNDAATFCGDYCVHQFRLRSDPGYLREHVFARDRGICSLCATDTLAAYADLKRTRGAKRTSELEVWGLASVHARRTLWDADHILPVAEGGGECDLDNLRTLCLPCHREVTAELRFRLKRVTSSTADSSG